MQPKRDPKKIKWVASHNCIELEDLKTDDDCGYYSVDFKFYWKYYRNCLTDNTLKTCLRASIADIETIMKKDDACQFWIDNCFRKHFDKNSEDNTDSKENSNENKTSWKNYVYSLFFGDSDDCDDCNENQRRFGDDDDGMSKELLFYKTDSVSKCENSKLDQLYKNLWNKYEIHLLSDFEKFEELEKMYQTFVNEKKQKYPKWQPDLKPNKLREQVEKARKCREHRKMGQLTGSELASLILYTDSAFFPELRKMEPNDPTITSKIKRKVKKKWLLWIIVCIWQLQN